MCDKLALRDNRTSHGPGAYNSSHGHGGQSNGRGPRDQSNGSQNNGGKNTGNPYVVPLWLHGVYTDDSDLPFGTQANPYAVIRPSQAPHVSNDDSTGQSMTAFSGTKKCDKARPSQKSMNKSRKSLTASSSHGEKPLPFSAASIPVKQKTILISHQRCLEIKNKKR